MKKILTMGTALFFLAAMADMASAQITPSGGMTPSQSISKTSKGKKGHGCHGKKCGKDCKSTTSK